MSFFNLKNCVLNRIFYQKKNKIFKEISNFFIDLLMKVVGLTHSQEYIYLYTFRFRTTKNFVKS